WALAGGVAAACLSALIAWEGGPESARPNTHNSDQPRAQTPTFKPQKKKNPEGRPAAEGLTKDGVHFCYDAAKEKEVVAGVLGRRGGSFCTNYNDGVVIHLELQPAGYCYLIGFNFNGQEQLLWPCDETRQGDATKVPERVSKFHYPQAV